MTRVCLPVKRIATGENIFLSTPENSPKIRSHLRFSRRKKLDSHNSLPSGMQKISNLLKTDHFGSKSTTAKQCSARDLSAEAREPSAKSRLPYASAERSFFRATRLSGVSIPQTPPPQGGHFCCWCSRGTIFVKSKHIYLSDLLFFTSNFIHNFYCLQY